VLQLANSAYFGRRSPVSKVTDAVAYLGIDTLRALLLHAEAFREFQVNPPIPGFDLQELHRHCTRVARLAGALLSDAGGGAGADALTAGLLHDIGLLVLASRNREGLADILERVRVERRPIHHVEQELHGVTHAEIGAHLLALWGLPHSVTEAVAGHHDHKWLEPPFDTVAAVQIATTLVEELEGERMMTVGEAPEPDLDYLERAGLASRLPHWRALATSPG
jgi:putative nucleotidyltransferase with HDIG domain